MRLAILRRASQAPGVSLRSGRQPLPHERRCLSAAAAALKRDGPGVPVISKEEYAARRRAVLAQMPSHSVAIFPSAQQQYMSEDVPHLFHQNTDLMYLSGCDEPGSVLVLDTTATEDGSETAAGGRSVLFLEPREEERERWDGPMLGVSDETRDALGIDGVAPVSTLPTMLGENLTKQGTDGGAACQRVFYDPSVNESVTGLVGTLPSKESQERFVSCWSRDRMPKHFVSRPRLIKSPAEAEMLRRACSAICGGLNDAMAHCTLLQDGAHLSSVRERTIEAHIEFGSKMRGATRMAFPSVVASGANGTVLHYMKNSDLAKDGDFVMVDAGCIVDGACSDVSRSWPVNGKFSGPQRDMYDLVLDVQLRCIDMAREGIKYRDRPVSMNVVHAFGSKALTEGLKTLGFMKDMSVEQALATGAYHVRPGSTAQPRSSSFPLFLVATSPFTWACFLTLRTCSVLIFSLCHCGYHFFHFVFFIASPVSNGLDTPSDITWATTSMTPTP